MQVLLDFHYGGQTYYITGQEDLPGPFFTRNPAGYTEVKSPVNSIVSLFATSMRSSPLLLSALLCWQAFLASGFARAGDAPAAMMAPSPPLPAVPLTGSGVLEPAPGLTKELVYAVLVGQIATQRGDHRRAFEHLLRAAKLAGDEKLAEQASRAALALGEDEAVGQSVDLWLKISPESLSAHQLAALIRLGKDDLDGAMYHLRRLVNLTSAEGDSGFVQLARLVHKMRPPQQRMELMERATV